MGLLCNDTQDSISLENEKLTIIRQQLKNKSYIYDTPSNLLSKEDLILKREYGRLKSRHNMRKKLEEYSLKRKIYREKNKELLKKIRRCWRINNKQKYNANRNLRRKIRNKQDIHYKLTEKLRKRLNQAIKAQGVKKYHSTVALLGCGINFLKEYLQSKFTEGMAWNNYGKWHIDHILPCSSFDLTREEEQRKCFHYTNLQPLWAIDNIKKGNKILV